MTHGAGSRSIVLVFHTAVPQRLPDDWKCELLLKQTETGSDIAANRHGETAAKDPNVRFPHSALHPHSPVCLQLGHTGSPGKDQFLEHL